MLRWLMWLFDSSDFFPRGECGDWSGGLALTWQIANGIIALSYFLIPAGLLHIYRKRSDLMPRPDLLLWFSAFIVFCGLTHILEIAVFYWPAYRFYTLIYGLTALVSLITATLLPSASRHFIELPSEAEIYRMNRELAVQVTRRDTEIASIRQAKVVLRDQIESKDLKINELQMMVEKLRKENERRQWISGVSMRLDQIKGELDALRGP